MQLNFKRILRYGFPTFVVALFLATTGAQAATLNVVAGILVGASGVDVGGTLYDVEFVDGTCVGLFSGCDSVDDFAFTTSSDALAASQALLDEVFIDGGPGLFDTHPELTQGCTSVSTCNALTPYAIGASSARSIARASNSSGIGDPVPATFTISAVKDLSFSVNETYAVWTLTPNPDITLTGSTVGGAFFKIVVPAVWNGDLVIWNHGFSLSPVGPVSDLGPLSAVQLSEGYAVAASSYQQLGWSLFKTKNDIQNMVSVFTANFGAPNAILVNGASLGGIVTAQTVEKANIGNVVGAYPICGAVAGSRNWDAAIDLRLVYDTVCANTPTAAIPGGATGLPAPGFPGYAYTTLQMALAANECMGILLPPAFRTPLQDANLAFFLSTTQLPANFILTDLGFGLFGYSNLIFDPAKLNGQQGVGNANVNYDNGGFIDTNIQRVSTNPGGVNRLKKNFTPVGNVGNVKIVSLHTDGDGLVIVENENEYAQVVPAANLTTAIVDEVGNTHCGFTASETLAGWESLRGWVAGGAQPTATSIQSTCVSIGGPAQCRIDPAFVIPDMDVRVRPR